MFVTAARFQLTPKPMPMNGTVKLANNQLTDPQDIGLVPVVKAPCWASDRAANLNLTIPSCAHLRRISK